MTQETKTENAVPSDLNISDLNLLRSVVDLATQRGAFRAAELSAVGKVYDKLDSFLNSVQAKQEENTAEQPKDDA